MLGLRSPKVAAIGEEDRPQSISSAQRRAYLKQRVHDDIVEVGCAEPRSGHCVHTLGVVLLPSTCWAFL